MNTNEENNPILQNVASSFMRNGNNINDNNTSFDLTRFYPTIAAAGAALAGGALYYLLNIMGKSKKNDESIIDFKNQYMEQVMHMRENFLKEREILQAYEDMRNQQKNEV